MPLSSSIEWHRIRQPTSDKPGANHGQLGRPGRLAKLAAGLLQTEELVWQPGLLCVGLGHLLLHASCDAAQLLAAGTSRPGRRPRRRAACPRVSSYYGYSPLDPAGNDGIVVVKDVLQS